MGTSCSVSNLDSRYQCVIASSNRIEILLNGNTLNNNIIYVLNIYNITFPNFDSSGIFFKISSYFNSKYL